MGGVGLVHRRRNDGRRLRSRGRWAVADCYQVRSVASNVAKAKRTPADVANGGQRDSPAVECPRCGRQVGAAQSCGCGGTRRLGGWEVIRDGWRQLVTVQACGLAGLRACRLAGVEAEGAGRAQARKGAERSCGKAVGVARRGEVRQAKVMFRGPGRSNRGLESWGNGLDGTDLAGVEKCVLLTGRAAGL